MDNSLIKLSYRVIDHYCTFKYLLSYIDFDFPDRSTSCFCPFHDNHDSPAAKLYQNPEGENIYCFSENKSYLPHHLLTLEIVPFTVNHVFSAIWEKLSDDEKNYFNEYIPKQIEFDFSEYFNEYKKCKIDYRTLLNTLRCK